MQVMKSALSLRIWCFVIRMMIFGVVVGANNLDDGRFKTCDKIREDIRCKYLDKDNITCNSLEIKEITITRYNKCKYKYRLFNFGGGLAIFLLWISM